MKRIVLLVVVATLALGAAGAWADLLTGNFITLDVDAASGVIKHMYYDSAGGGSTAKDWLKPGLDGAFSFFSIYNSTAGVNTGAATWLDPDGVTIHNGIGFAAGTQGLLGSTWDYKWDAVSNGITVLNELTFNQGATGFTLATTISNTTQSAALSGNFALGFDPNVDMPGTDTTSNSYGIFPTSNPWNGSPNFVHAQGPTSLLYMTLGSGGLPVLMPTYGTDASVLYGLGTGTAGTNDDNIALADEFHNIARGGDGNIRITHFDFGPNETPGATPELGTFALMGLSMLPMAGLALRRRRRSA
jgi:hypothetical protein